jgi:osmoprotectant transport system substrate-binding protein
VLRPTRWLLAAVLLAGCAGEGPEPAPEPDAVVVASFDFAESELLGELYAQALEQAGVPVRRELALGPRELVLPALQQGLVDVVPEYLGTALVALDGDAAPAARLEPAGAHAQLAAALRQDGLRALPPAAAQNQNGLAVTRQTAARLGLSRTSDLQLHAPDLALAGPPECPGRAHCLPGLQSVYGLAFGDFVPYDAETQRVTALEQGVVDVAVVFTSGGLLATGDLVVLTDDRGLQPPENIVPVVSERAVERHGEQVAQTLEAVSAALDPAGLTFLNWRVEVGGQTKESEAGGWLQRHGLAAR